MEIVSPVETSRSVVVTNRRIFAVDRRQGRPVGEPCGDLVGHKGSVVCLCFSPSGTLVATGGSDSTLRLWVVSSQQCVAVSRAHKSLVTDVSFHGGGEQVASSSADGTVGIWDVKIGENRELSCKLQVMLRGHDGPVNSVRYNSRGDCFVTASDDKTARVWSTIEQRPRYSLAGHTGSVTCAVFAPNDRALVTLSADKQMRLFSAENFCLLWEKVVQSSCKASVAFSWDSATLFSACSGGGRSHVGHSRRCGQRRTSLG